MAKTHYNPTPLTEDMTVAQIMLRKTACGSKATDRAALYMTDDWAHVDCVKCQNVRGDVERQAAHKARVAAIEAGR